MKIQNHLFKSLESKGNKIQDEEDIENAQPYYVIDYYSRQILFYYIRYIHDLEEGFSEKHAKVMLDFLFS